MSRLAETVSELESELETLASDTSNIARMRRITPGPTR